MIERAPLSVNGREWEGGLWWMVLASGGLHAATIGLLLLIPPGFMHHPPALVSYTVDLVAPDKVGGSNIIKGGKGRVEAAPLVAAAPVPKPQRLNVPVPKPQAAKPPAAKAPARAEPEKRQPAPPKVAAPPQHDEVMIAAKRKKVEPARPAVKAAPPRVKPAAKVARAAPAKRAAPRPRTHTRAAKAAAARKRNARIAAAIKRVRQQAGRRGGGSGPKAGVRAGGPIAAGPGQGAGGAVRGVEYLVYYNRMINRIKHTWAWAGSDQSLEAVVQFHITESGEVLDVRIMRSSGDPGYDASVVRAVEAANPLPAPPAAYRTAFHEVEITFAPEQ
ncbi:MAG: energy transducer TonB [Candidatus Binatia bacterium]